MNNMAKYEALIIGLRLATELKIEAIQVYNDSQLVVNQVNSTCEVTDITLTKYVAMISNLRSCFEKFQLTKIPKFENE